MTKRPDTVDMSRTAVTARLEEVGALYKLWLSLQTIRLDQAKTVDQVQARKR